MSANPTTILGKIGKKVGEEVKTVSTAISTHSSKTDNPHSVTKTQVGLGNVDDVALSTWAGSANITTVGTLSSGTVPYSLLSGVPDVNNISGNLTIGGNLTVGGQTTTLNTETVLVEDNIIELNMKSDGDETAQTSGIQVNRGAGSAGTSTETIASNFTSVVFNKTGDNVTSIDVTDSNSATVNYAYAGSSFSLNALQGNFNTDNGYYDSANNLSIQIEESDDQLSRVYLLDDGDGSETDVATYDFSEGSSAEDKATIIWDDNSGQATWKFGLGSSDADIKVKDVVATGVVKVPSGNGLTINNVSIGDYALFESALNTAKS